MVLWCGINERRISCASVAEDPVLKQRNSGDGRLPWNSRWAWFYMARTRTNQTGWFFRTGVKLFKGLGNSCLGTFKKDVAFLVTNKLLFLLFGLDRI